jgi:hypothetical protein
MRKLFLIILSVLSLVYILIFAMLHYTSVQYPAEWKWYQNQEFKVQFPAHSAILEETQKDWKGFYSSGNSHLGVYYYKRNQKWTLEDSLQYHLTKTKNIVFSKELPLLDGGYFILRSYGKGWRRYIYVFGDDENVYWMVNGSSNSSINTPKKILDYMLKTFETKNGEKIIIANTSIDEIDKDIFWHAQGKDTFIAYMGYIFLAILAFAYTMMNIAGRLPDKIEGTPLFSASHIYIKYRKLLTYKLNIGAVMLTDQYLYFTIFKRPYLKLPFNELEKVELSKKGTNTILTYRDSKIKIWAVVESFPTHLEEKFHIVL